ncbi:MAG: DUF805 domain-containing protein [Bacteroidia bacterium]
MKYYIKAFNNFSNFNGRARRKEYWMYLLFNLIFALVAIILDNAFGLAFESIGYGVIYLLYSLITFIPSLSVSVRRLHDKSKSGWYLLLAIIPIIGGIVLLFILAADGDPGENEYGMNPKELPEEDI